MSKKSTINRDYRLANGSARAIKQDACDVFFDIEVETDGTGSNDAAKETIPTYRDAFNFIVLMAKERFSEYLTPFNILIAKAVSIILIAVLLFAGAVTGIVRAHIRKEEAKEAARQAEIEAAEEAAREEKRQAVIAENEAVVGKWYEMDPAREDIRTLLIEVDDDANCVYTIGDETGSFEYTGKKLTVEGDSSRILMLGEDVLADETAGVSYYRTDAGIESLKFAEFLRQNMPGTYQDILGTYFYIYPDGRWVEYHSWVGEKSGTWSFEIGDECVSMVFEGMGVHYGGGNVYKVLKEDFDYERSEIKGGDFSFTLDTSYYEKISSKLP